MWPCQPEWINGSSSRATPPALTNTKSSRTIRNGAHDGAAGVPARRTTEELSPIQDLTANTQHPLLSPRFDTHPALFSDILSSRESWFLRALRLGACP